MKVLFSGYKNPNYRAVTDFIEQGLRDLGHDVTYVDYRGYRLPGRLRDRLPALERWDRAAINARIVETARRLRPTLFLVNGGATLEPETIRDVKAAGATTALWVSDYPLLADRYIALAPHYDHYFLSGTDALEHHRRAGNDRGRFLPFACLPEIHKPVALGPGDERFRSDVFFAGSNYPERAESLTAIARLGVDVAIWGPGWDRLASGHPLRRHVRGGPMPTEDFIKAASGCKIAFNHMGYPMRPQMEEMCNSRVFELLGCGACQLVDAKEDVKLLFPESGRDLAWFDGEARLLELVRFYLSRDDERRALGRRAREAALGSHTYRHRLEELFRVCAVSGPAAKL